MHELCSGIRCKLKQDSYFFMSGTSNWQPYIAEDYLGVELNDQSFEIMEKFYFTNDMIGARVGAVEIYFNKDKDWK